MSVPMRIGVVVRRFTVLAVLCAVSVSCTPSVRPAVPTVTPSPVATVPTGILVTPGTLLVCSDAQLPPPQEMLFNGEAGGSDVDFARVLAQRVGLVLRLIDTPTAGVAAALKSGRCDMAVSAIRGSSNLGAGLEVVPYLEIFEAILVAKAKTGTITAVNDLCGKRVAALGGSAEEAIIAGSGDYTGRGLSSACSTPIVAQSFTSDTDALAALADGTVDGFLAASPLAGYEMQQHGDVLVRVDGLTTASDSEVIVIRPGAGAADLKSAVTTALNSLVQDGTFASILRKYGIAN